MCISLIFISLYICFLFFFLPYYLLFSHVSNAVYFRATFTLEKVKKEEPEFVSMGVATPVSGFDTIKRAETRVADTDTYKGRVQKLPQDEMVRIYRCHRVLKVDQKLLSFVRRVWPVGSFRWERVPLLIGAF